MLRVLRNVKFDLYRFFFPTGWLFGFWGAFLWILFVLNFIDYPGAQHPDIMVGGFLLCFVSGFITTAAPQFTNSHPPTVWDLRWSVFFTSLLFIALIPHNIIYFRLAVLAQFLFLTWFVIQRVIHRKSNPPMPFVFILFGLFCGIVGMLLVVTDTAADFGRLLFLQGYILSFILGIGSRLVPALLGNVQTDFKLKTILITGLVLISSFAIEVYLSVFAGTSIRNIIIMLVAFVAWKIHKLPRRRGYQAWGLWIAAWSMVIGSLAASFFPYNRIHFLHLLFISGISMLTLMIGTRVSLSHGKHDLSPEMKSKHILWTVGLIILAALTRSTAGFMPRLYEHHLAYAALVWIAALFTWGWLMLPKIFHVNPFKLVKSGK